MAKSQVATEYLFIVAVGLIILIPLVIFLNDIYIGYKDGSKTSAAQMTVNKLASLANWVYSQGEPARATATIYIPESVESISFNGKNINFRIKTKSGFTDISKDAIANVTGVLPTKAGYYNVLVAVHENIVNISVIR